MEDSRVLLWRYPLSDTPPIREAQRAVERGTLAWWQVALVAGVAIALAAGLLLSIGYLFRPLIILALAIVLASAVEPGVLWLSRWKWISRPVAVVAVYLAVLAFFGGVAWYTIPRIALQAQELIQELPDLVDDAIGVIGAITIWDEAIGEWGLDALLDQVTGLAGYLATLPLTVVRMAFDIIVMFVLAIYWSVFLPQLRRFLLSLFPASSREEVRDIMREIGHMMGGFIRAVMIDAVIVGLIVYVALVLIGVRFPILLALIAAIGEFVPIVGPFVGGAAAVGVALLESPTQAIIVLVFYLVLQQIESNILVPIIVHRTASVPPPLALFAVMVGAALGGPLVAIAAIPLSGAIQVLVLRVFAPMVRRWSGAANDPPPPEEDDQETEGGSDGDEDHEHASDDGDDGGNGSDDDQKGDVVITRPERHRVRYRSDGGTTGDGDAETTGARTPDKGRRQ